MAWFVGQCPKCSYSDFEVSMEKTLEHYDNLYDLGTNPISLLNEDPPFMPEEFVMVCENPSCGHIENWTVDRLVAEFRDSLARYAWSSRKRNRPENLFRLEDSLVQYFKDNDQIVEEQLEGNMYLRNLYLKARSEKV